MGRRRRQFREIEVIETLILQGETVCCYRCKIAFTIEDVRARNIHKEHLHEFGLEGPDEPENCRFSHAAAPCHHTVTNGTKATSAGSSKHRMAKANEPGRTEKFKVKKPDAETGAWHCGRCGESGEGSSLSHICRAPKKPKPQRPGFAAMARSFCTRERAWPDKGTRPIRSRSMRIRR